jgi:DNA-binding SARP family transcriptional activator
MTLALVQSRSGKQGTDVVLQESADALGAMHAEREAAQAQLWLAHARLSAGSVEDAHRHVREALRIAERLGPDGLLDLPARWDPALFVRCGSDGIEPDRLSAALERVSAPPVVVERGPARTLPALAAYALGPGIAVIDDTAEVSWKWDKVRELFFLLLHSGPRRREQLVTMLWPDIAPEKAQAALHTAVYRLRRAVQRDLVVLHDGVYRLNTEFVTGYDVRQFEQLIKRADAGDGTDAMALLQRAADLYKGAFLQDIDADWCRVERTRLERDYMTVLERLEAGYLAAGRPRDCVAVAERLVAIDPLREDVHARMIRAYLRLGNRSAARRQLEYAMTMVRRDLGLAPGPELAALGRRLGVPMPR